MGDIHADYASHLHSVFVSINKTIILYAEVKEAWDYVIAVSSSVGGVYKFLPRVKYIEVE